MFIPHEREYIYTQLSSYSRPTVHITKISLVNFLSSSRDCADKNTLYDASINWKDHSHRICKYVLLRVDNVTVLLGRPT